MLRTLRISRILACSALAYALPVQAQKADTLIRNGPSANRIDIALMGDGWTTPTQEPPLVADLDSHIRFMFTVEPYRRYAKFFNAYRVEHYRAGPPAGTGWQTRANMDYYIAHINRAVSGTDLYYVVSREGKGHDKMGDGYNTGNERIFAAPTLDPDIVALHLMGHAWHRLGDTYAASGNNSDFWPNKTNAPTSRKWERWLGFVEPFNKWKVGVYPIPSTTDSYRELPSSDCMMADVWKWKTMPIVHSPGEREKIVHDIYARVDPLDGHSPNAGVQANPMLSVKPVDPAVIQVDWYVDGRLARKDGGASFLPAAHVTALGPHTVKAHAFDRVLNHAFSDKDGGAPDSLDWVRNEASDLQQEVTWSVDITQTSGIARGAGPARTARDRTRTVFPHRRGGSGETETFDAGGRKLEQPR